MIEWFEAHPGFYTYAIIPFLIFFARICDQSIGTLRLILISKGYKTIAPFIGFFEVIIWVLAISQIFKHLDNIVCYLAYGAGFATGNYIGILLEERISLGTALIRIIPRYDTTDLITYLSERGYGLTFWDAEGRYGNVKIILTIIKRKEIPQVVDIINRFNPNAFYTIEEIKAVNKGILKDEKATDIFRNLIFGPRKAK
ncbi:MAG TPA: DUF2179 domain-containing protein [Bacteroidales bacterium]|jgi:uncharacterized protein YebE (UPF0316 family)|nr:DUF2179 domain-containing protein [Bacteroidales bacterium]MDI9573522.1 DUF2179 domain-containing protein [Bacteroidota bacterium]OQC59212.1 MAG: hypothetical protein BWX51_01639 [Bacteroidetes bacterium ADurb.Bin012]MBP9512714.1 DUF2179 domain-containing protein [Bacteroidales bacterium]MBP9589359.1 DUF2179 domain-containing protein [Bacteroidales bacterium]